jgi:DNA-binding response OmpR family regulator
LADRRRDETALFLHRDEATLPEAQRKMSRDVRRADSMLEGSSALERYRMVTSQAVKGRGGIEALKANPDDRAKCIDAGASDYITKPVDVEELVSLWRVWRYR